jgi:hypothetical protein
VLNRSTRRTLLICLRFFRHLSPLSPILSDYYSNRTKYGILASEEPFLCCTILTLSSRYHVLPGNDGLLRTHDIHRKLWHHWKQLYSRLTLGEDAGPGGLTRSIGTIESLVLMTEWHPFELSVPPEPDVWEQEYDRPLANSVDSRLHHGQYISFYYSSLADSAYQTRHRKTPSPVLSK